jgi:hypothetical protein
MKYDHVEALTAWSKATRGKSTRARLTTDVNAHFQTAILTLKVTFGKTFVVANFYHQPASKTFGKEIRLVLFALAFFQNLASMQHSKW